MEKFQSETCRSLVSKLPRLTTVEDLPGDMLDLITKKLNLLEHYKGWAILMAPYSLGASPFSTDWFLKELKTFWRTVDSKTSFSNSEDVPNRYVLSHHFPLKLFEPGQGKEQEIVINIEEVRESLNQLDPPSEIWFTGDKGLLFLSNEMNPATFLVFNPLSFSISVLPSIPSFSSSLSCSQRRSADRCVRFPLKLMVDAKQENGLKGSQFTCYKAYIVERDPLHPLNMIYVPNDRKKVEACWSFRIFVYDSITRLWGFTGIHWLSKSYCPYAQIFPMTDGSFYVSVGYHVDEGYIREVLYKFQDKILIRKIQPPYRRKKADTCTSDVTSNHYWPENCGCASATFFEAEGKIFFFKQTSWIGSFGPNCISATLWELDFKAMKWWKLAVLPPHRLETSCKQYNDDILSSKEGITFRYLGLLLVVHVDSGLCYVAAFDITKKTWCKVPEKILTTVWWSWSYLSGNIFDLDRFVFQPNLQTTA